MERLWHGLLLTVCLFASISIVAGLINVWSELIGAVFGWGWPGFTIYMAPIFVGAIVIASFLMGLSEGD